MIDLTPEGLRARARDWLPPSPPSSPRRVRRAPVSSGVLTKSRTLLLASVARTDMNTRKRHR